MSDSQDGKKLISAVVPSLRIDVLGARAFKVSRAYFAKGVASGNVSIDGAPAGKSSQVQAGQRVSATGLGEFELHGVEGSTRKGNLRVNLLVLPTLS